MLNQVANNSILEQAQLAIRQQQNLRLRTQYIRQAELQAQQDFAQSSTAKLATRFTQI